MASVLQTIFTLPTFQKRYYEPTATMYHAATCTVPLPAECVECQTRKVADGLLSGRYSHPSNVLSPSGSPPQPTQAPTALEGSLEQPSPTPVFQLGIKPTTFKVLIGKGHEEFATMRQQDAEEFFTHLLTVLRRDGQKYKERAEQGRRICCPLDTYLKKWNRSDPSVQLCHGTTTPMYLLYQNEVPYRYSRSSFRSSTRHGKRKRWRGKDSLRGRQVD